MASIQLPNVSCVSLGMVIIDDIHFPNNPNTPDERDVVGGSATFVTLGQRLFAPDPAEVGCLVIAGDDFPPDVEEKIRGWGITAVLTRRPNARSTRGKLVYEDDTFGPKTFEYTAGPLKASPTDLVDTSLLHAKAFHLFGAPGEILHQIPELLKLREQQGIKDRPLVVWEPLPASCMPANRQVFLEACKMVDVFSPNHIELTAIFTTEKSEGIDKEKLERYAKILLDSPIGPTGSGSVIIRAGEYGALSLSRTSRPTWLSAYYHTNSPKVVDPTGAGNAFLGGYIAGWQQTSDIHQAIYYGHVAASFALEQIGLPRYEKKNGKELWNGVMVMDRLAEYRRHLANTEVLSNGVV